LGQTKREPDDWLGGDRHKDGVTLLQAIERNIGTCHLDAIPSPATSEYGHRFPR
jgi:hypothetical protein